MKSALIRVRDSPATGKGGGRGGGQNGWVLDGPRDDRMSGLMDAHGRTMKKDEVVSSQTQTGYRRISRNYQRLRC